MLPDWMARDDGAEEISRIDGRGVGLARRNPLASTSLQALLLLLASLLLLVVVVEVTVV